MWDADFGSPGWVSLPQEDRSLHSQRANLSPPQRAFPLHSLRGHLQSHHQDDRRGLQLCLISQDLPVLSTCLSLTFPRILLQPTTPPLSYQASSGTKMAACFSAVPGVDHVQLTPVTWLLWAWNRARLLNLDHFVS